MPGSRWSLPAAALGLVGVLVATLTAAAPAPAETAAVPAAARCVSQVTTTVSTGAVASVQADTGTYLVTLLDGTIYGWGLNQGSRFQDGTTVSWDSPTVAQALMDQGYDQIEFGEDATIALKDGQVYTWGSGQYGQLGTGSYLAPGQAVGTPQHVTALAGETVVQVAAGWGWNAALTDDGRVFTWGWNNWGTLGHTSVGNEGNGTVTNVPTPTLVPGIPAVASIQVGTWSALAITTDGDVWGWGRPTAGVLGNGRDSTTTGGGDEGQTPVRIDQLSGLGLTEIALTELTGAGRTTDGKVYTWGDTVNGATGQVSPSWPALPAQILADQTVVSLGGDNGLYYVRGGFIALTDAGTVYFWGDNYQGWAGNGTTTAVTTPTQVDLGGETVQVLSAGGGSAAVVTTTGKLYTWGNTPSGDLLVPTLQMEFGGAELTTTNYSTSIAASWTSTVDSITGYTLTWSTADQMIGSRTVDAGTTAFTVTGLTPSTDYQLELTATTSTGVSAVAPIITQVTTLAPPSFTMTAPATATSGEQWTVGLTAQDEQGATIATDLTGMVTLSSTAADDVIDGLTVTLGAPGTRTLTAVGPCGQSVAVVEVAAVDPVDPTPTPTDPTTPPTDPTPSPSTTAGPGTTADPGTTVVAPGVLAITGTELAWGGVIALLLIVVGVGVVAARRRHLD